MIRAYIFATSNVNKAREIESALPEGFRIITMKDAGFDIDIPEPFTTLEENSRHKAQTIYKLTGQNCFAEDTGLEVESLQGAPGVRSARFAGLQRNDERNMQKLLALMKNTHNRRAHFRTVITLIEKGKEFQFEGVCYGSIIEEKRGKEGFGYDPVFRPEGSLRTFAELTLAEKNECSHRKKALSSMIAYLKTNT